MQPVPLEPAPPHSRIVIPVTFGGTAHVAAVHAPAKVATEDSSGSGEAGACAAAQRGPR